MTPPSSLFAVHWTDRRDGDDGIIAEDCDNDPLDTRETAEAYMDGLADSAPWLLCEVIEYRRVP